MYIGELKPVMEHMLLLVYHTNALVMDLLDQTDSQLAIIKKKDHNSLLSRVLLLQPRPNVNTIQVFIN
jgi:hypothetical protein